MLWSTAFLGSTCVKVKDISKLLFELTLLILLLHITQFENKTLNTERGRGRGRTKTRKRASERTNEPTNERMNERTHGFKRI